MKQKIIIDTDSGMDDIIAIAMIISSGNFLIKVITTVRGLVTPIIGKKNLSKIINFFDTKIKIVSGLDTPINKNRLKFSFPDSDRVNSTKLTFLKSLLKPVKIQKQKYKVEDFIYKQAKTSGGISLLCLGPLTNIAKVIQKYGIEFTKNINEITIMGGAVYASGNVAPAKYAEYNIFLDPEAAEIVFCSGVQINLVSIDATKFAPATTKLKNKIENYKPKTKYGEIIKSIIIANKNDFDYFYDPLAAGVLIDPKIIIESKNVKIKIAQKGINVGQTLPTAGLKNVGVITQINSKRFFNLLKKTIQ